MKPITEQSGFQPAWWCPGPHAQTVWRKLFGETPRLPVTRERWDTPDDDFLDLDFVEPPADQNTPGPIPVVLLLHGLEGSSRSKYILGMLEQVRRKGWIGVALNFRSCSGEINRQRRFYHSGEITDLDWVVQKLIGRYPDNPILIIGFSLGGSVLLRWLGENGDRVPSQLQASAAVSVPYDLGVAARRIDRSFSRIYGSVFLKTLKQKALLKARMFPGIIEPERVPGINSFAQFDNDVTAPFHGFKDGEDYWNSCSALNFLDGVRMPTLLISAGNDPFCPDEVIPKRVIGQSKWLEGDFHSSGGHVGFVSGTWPWAPHYWAEQRALAYLREHLI